MNFEMLKLDLEKAEEPEIDIHWIIEKARVPKKIYFCFLDYAKAFDCVDHNKLWKILEMRIPDHLTCFLRNPYACQAATELDMEQTGSKSGKEYTMLYIVTLFNL